MKRSFFVDLAAMLVASLILAACSSSPPPRSVQQSSRPAPKWAGIVLTGEDEPLLEGTTWINGSVDSDHYINEFRGGGILVYTFRYSDPLRGGAISEDRSRGTWQRDGNIIKCIPSGGFAFYEGRYYPQTQKIMLTGEGSDGSVWDQTWELQQGSSVASRPSVPSSTTNVYVQPSAPAQSSTPAPAPVPSAPTFQTGTYAWSNSGVNMTMSFNFGMVSAFLNRSGIWSGRYSINGDQLVITVTSATGDYSRLQGMTYSYTITSNTSFSGSGETWVRTGY